MLRLSYFIYLIIYCLFIFSACSTSNQISKKVDTILLKDTAISQGHIGISIYEPATGKYLYNHNSTNYFIPASNTKLFTLYAGMKYIGDSLPGIKIMEYENSICLVPTADPTLLHPYYKKQPVFDFLSATKKSLWSTSGDFKANAYGSGWAWDDYNESFMNERSALPVFGNNIVFSGTRNNINYFPKGDNNNFGINVSSAKDSINYINKVEREVHQNNFTIQFEGRENKSIVVPFITSVDLAFKLLADSLHKNIAAPDSAPSANVGIPKTYVIYSQPSDSLFKPMMYNSDNFFAEQTLLMASNEKIGYISDEAMIDTLLRSDFKDIPQKPRWVDGSGLSRYNLFTAQDFIYILSKMQQEFGFERLKAILPTGGQGSLKNYFIADSSFVFAKTGSMSNNAALSGFIITKKGKLLIFSILTNNFPTGATPVRRAVEKFLHQLRETY